MRIGFVGGPGTGKSTQAALLFAHLKKQGRDVELVMEYMKAWIHEKRPLKQDTQIYALGKQMNYESRWLSHGTKHIVTDSPLVIAAFHAHKYVTPELGEIKMQDVEFFGALHDEHLIFLKRGNFAYQKEGRFQTEQEAREMDVEILDFVYSHYTKEQVTEIRVGDDEAIFALGMRLTA
jgi:deoxyadenosine/deoxycytidine kinase